MTTPPTREDFLEETDILKEVEREDDMSWRHGVNRTVVFLRECDSTFWCVSYRCTPDGDYDGLCEGEYDVAQVWPKQIMKTIYTTERST